MAEHLVERAGLAGLGGWGTLSDGSPTISAFANNFIGSDNSSVTTKAHEDKGKSASRQRKGRRGLLGWKNHHGSLMI